MDDDVTSSQHDLRLGNESLCYCANWHGRWRAR